MTDVTGRIEPLRSKAFMPVLLVVGSAVAFACGWWLLDRLREVGAFGYLVISDTPTYLNAATRISSGQLPYRDFPFEYPPLAIAPMLAAEWIGGLDPVRYSDAFEIVMLGCGVLMASAVAGTLWLSEARWWRWLLVVGFTALFPVLVGPVVLTRYDLWPAALTAVAVAAVVGRHERIGSAFLALGTMAKVYPALLIPLAIAVAWHRRGAREAAVCVAVTVLVALALLGPFVLVGPSGVIAALQREISRPLQIESLGSALLMGVHVVTGLPLTVVTSAGSQNLAGPLPTVLAALLTLPMAVTFIVTWRWFAVGAATPGRFLRAAAALTLAYVALGKVLSPQYLIWLVPLVPLVGGRRGLIAAAAVGAACLLTQAWFPTRYFEMVRSMPVDLVTAVLARDVALVTALAAVVTPADPAIRAAASIRLSLSSATVYLRARPGLVLGALLLASLALRLVWLGQPSRTLMSGETAYVNAARSILGITVPAGQPFARSAAGRDPDLQHPPLGEIVVAGSMAIAGDGAVGWRLPSVVAGTLLLLAVYLIVRTLGGTAWLAVLSATLAAMDTLVFVQSRLATADALAATAMLFGAWLGLRRRPALAGILFALGALVSMTAALGMLAFVVWEGGSLIARRRSGHGAGLGDLVPIAAGLAAFGVVFVGGLWLLDLRYTDLTSPLANMPQLLGSALAPTPAAGLPSNSRPWEWLVNGGQFDYMTVVVNALANGQVVSSHTAVDFRAVLNPVLIGSAPIVAGVAWSLARAGESLVRWPLVWASSILGPIILWSALTGSSSSLDYFLPVVPALAIATALVILRLPRLRPITWGYLAACLLGFLYYFPFRQIP